MYLTIDDNERASLWEEQPAYFSDCRKWNHPGTALINNVYFPSLAEVASGLGIKPGPEGILKVIFDIVAAEVKEGE